MNSASTDSSNYIADGNFLPIFQNRPLSKRQVCQKSNNKTRFNDTHSNKCQAERLCVALLKLKH